MLTPNVGRVVCEPREVLSCPIFFTVPYALRSVNPVRTSAFYLIYLMISVIGTPSANAQTVPSSLERMIRNGQHLLVYEITEESKRGTIVGNVASDLIQIISRNDKNSEPKIDLTITNWRDPEAKYFSLDPHTGYLRVMLPPDRELLCPGITEFNSDYTIRSATESATNHSFNFSNSEIRGSQNPDTQCRITLQIAYSVRSSIPRAQEQTDFSQFQLMNQDPGLILVKIIVLDINDHNPRFPQSRLDVELGEISSSPGKTTIELPTAFDPDAGLNGSLIYWVGQFEDSTKSTNAFGSSPTSNEFSSWIPFRLEGEPLRLVLTDALDWERQRNFNLVVYARDMGTPVSRTGQIDVHVTVRDENDNTPKFLQPMYSVVINESTLRGTIILELQATDEDSASNGQLTFSLASPVNSMERAASQYFGIRTVSSHKAVIFVLQTPDIDGKKRAHQTDLRLSNAITQYPDHLEPSYMEFVLHAIVRDNGYPRQLSSRTQIKVRVMDVNDMAPTIFVSYLHTTPNNRDSNTIQSNQASSLFIADHNHGQINENVNRGFIGFVTVQDLDSSVWGQVNCQTDNDAFELILVTDTEVFNRDESHYVSQYASPTPTTLGEYGFKLFSTKSFDREQISEVSFKITCVDNPHYYPSPTIFTNQNYHDSLLAFGQNPQQPYDISNKIGSNIQLTGTAIVRVFIADENDNVPVFMKNEYTFIIEETDRQLSDSTGYTNTNKESHTAVGKVTATDQDSTSVLHYYLMGDSMKFFNIDKMNGNIYAIQEFDRENLLNEPNSLQISEPDSLSVEITSDNSVYLSFPVYATDGQYNTSAKVKVLIRDINDNIPLFEKSHYEFHIVENEQLLKGESIGKVTATDADYGMNANIAYHLLDIDLPDQLDGNYSLKISNTLNNRASRTYFTVSMTSGQLHLIRKLDRELQMHHVFYITAVDNPHEQYKKDTWHKLDTVQQGFSKFRSTSKSHTATATVTIIVLDVNDNAPTITYPLPHGIVNVEAEAPAGHNLFTVLAYDPDAGENGTVRFTLNTASFETVHTFEDDSVNLLSNNNSNSNHTNRVTDLSLIKPTSLFAIDETTGIVFVTEKLSDQSANYLVMIGAHDLGQPIQRKTTITVTIRVQNTKLHHVFNSLQSNDGMSDSRARPPFHSDAQNPRPNLMNTETISTLSQRKRSDEEPIYNFHSYATKIDQFDSMETRKSGSSSSRFRLFSLSDRTVVIILAIVFTLLLITTVILIFLIKRRRDAGSRRIESGKSNYRASRNINLPSKVVSSNHLPRGSELIGCSNPKLNDLSNMHVIHPLVQQHQQLEDSIDRKDFNSSSDYGLNGYPKFYESTTNEFESNNHQITSSPTSNNYQHFYAPTLLGTTLSSLRRSARFGSDSSTILERNGYQKNTKCSRPDKIPFNAQYQTIGSFLVPQDEHLRNNWSRTLKEHDQLSPAFCTISIANPSGDRFQQYGSDLNSYTVLGPTTDDCCDQQAELEQFTCTFEANKSNPKATTLSPILNSSEFNNDSPSSIKISTNNTKVTDNTCFELEQNTNDTNKDLSCKICIEPVQTSTPDTQNKNINFQDNLISLNKVRTNSSGSSKHTAQSRGVTFV